MASKAEEWELQGLVRVDGRLAVVHGKPAHTHMESQASTRWLALALQTRGGGGANDGNGNCHSMREGTMTLEPAVIGLASRPEHGRDR